MGRLLWHCVDDAIGCHYSTLPLLYTWPRAANSCHLLRYDTQIAFKTLVQ